ncbi:hypothetical protein [Cellulomonas carbonis]|uniref:hypothetical protein n=1 Tax=Cellulomonas carbonis TaxID=1386092 RepID=UPI000A5DD7BC|nr:hypothetical protein [Cellulomonas carbonis]GGC02789.1 hypothetical protein GCM10010972_14750 [Cellulomonas carbonis]
MPRPTPAARRRRLRRAVAAVTAVAMLATALAGAVLAFAPPARAATDDTTGPAGAAGADRVVLVGTAGLRWDDVHTLSTPALWELSRSGSIGTVAARSVRSSACPADGWLAVSAGARAADLPGERYGECRALRSPSVDAPVPGWSDYVEAASRSRFDATLGLLGTLLRSEQVPAAGFGPGAAIALADGDGTVVGTHQALPRDPGAITEAVEVALDDARLVVVDAGAVRDIGRATVPRPEDEPEQPDDDAPVEPQPTGEEPEGPQVITEPTRAQQVQPVDARIAAVLEAVDDWDGGDVTVLVVSLADSGTVARMQLAAAAGPAPDGERYVESLLGTRSTRQPGYLQATDVTPTLLALLGLSGEAPAGALVGSPVRPVPGPGSAIERLAAVVDVDRHQVAADPVIPRTYTWLIVVNLLLQAVVVVGLNGRVIAVTGALAHRVRDAAARRRSAHVPTGRAPHAANPMAAVPVLRGLLVAGVAVGSFPVATTLANLVPWWRVTSSGWAVVGAIGLGVAVLSTLALLPPVRRAVLGPMGVVAGATALVLAVDVATGARLQLSAPLGVEPVVGARFYGFNNTSFALFASASLLVAAAVADPLVRAGRRRRAAVVVAVIGVVATVLNGTPGLGSDFGGPPALVPGFAILALLAAGIRLSWRRILLVGGGAGIVVLAFLLADWLRPPEDRTHLGRFVDTVLDGGLGAVVGRKLSQNVANLGGTWLTLLAIGGIALVVTVLAQPLRRAAAATDGGAYGWLSSGEPLTNLGTAAPMLRPAVLALAVTLGIGFLVNDSGIVIPAMGVSVAVPLLVAVSAGWLLRVRAERDALEGRTDQRRGTRQGATTG